MSVRPAVIGAAAAVFVLAAPAAALNSSDWERDALLVQRSVIETLDTEYQRTRDRESWEDYQAAFANGVERFDGIIDPGSLQILREIAVQLDQDFDEFNERLRWQDASFYVRTKIQLTTFILRAGEN